MVSFAPMKLLSYLVFALFALTSLQAQTAQDLQAYRQHNDLSKLPKNEDDTLRFQFGSCAFYNKALTGKNFRIFETMQKTPAHLMLWLGDHVYLLTKKQYGSRKGMEKGYIHQRKLYKVWPFMQSRPQFAIWDDHEYGPDNADGTFRLKDTSLAVFKHFWDNPSYGLPNTPGVFTHFKVADTEFFLTDGRFHRYKEPRQMLGREQMNWLKESLKASTARFKFIAFGSQVLNTGVAENLSTDNPEEYKELLGFIESEKISGVIFLSGDRHFAELSKLERAGTYPLYDITSSALCSPYFPYRGVKYNNKHVEGTFFKGKNFGLCTIYGKGEARACHLELKDIDGNTVWERTWKASELLDARL